MCFRLIVLGRVDIACVLYQSSNVVLSTANRLKERDGRHIKLKIPIVKFKNKISGRAKEFLFVYSYQAQHKRTSNKLN